MTYELFEIGDEVFVRLPNGIKKGVIASILPNHGFFDFNQETKFEVHGIEGEEFVTITSARSIRKSE